MLVRRQAEAEPELRIVLEQRIRPGRSAAFLVLCPGRDRQITAVDRRAAGRIGDLGAVAEQLGQQLEVRSFAAAGAGAGELEQRLEELHAAHIGEIDPRPVIDRQCLEERHVAPFRLDQRQPVAQVDRLEVRLGRAVGGTNLDAQPAARAVLDVELQREAHIREAAHVDRRRFEGGRGAVELVLMIVFRANDGVRADEAALAALDADVRLPYRHDVGKVALLEGGGARRKGAVDRHQAHWDLVAARLEHLGGHLADELRRLRRHNGRAIPVARRVAGTLTSCKRSSVPSTARKLRCDHLLALFGIGLADRLLDATIASSRGSTPEMAKKQVCRMVLMRPRSPTSCAAFEASMTKKRSLCSMICCCIERGRWSHTSSAP